MDFWVGVLIGVFIGGTIGALIMACCALGKEADRAIALALRKTLDEDTIARKTRERSNS